MKTIIAPTDFSKISLNAVNYAADLAREINAELILIHVDDSLLTCNDSLETTIDYSEAHNTEQLKNLCNKILERINNKIKVRTENVPGIVFNEIENLCALEKPFAIVMATHSPSTFERVILGSVTLSVANNVTLPVLIVPDKITFHLSSEGSLPV